MLLEQEVLKKKSSDLLKEDAGFIVDELFWQSSCGSIGNHRLLDVAMDTLPTHGKGMDIEQSIQLQTNLINSGLFKFADESTQAIVNDCHNSLRKMISGDPPTIHGQTKPEAARLMNQLQFFCRVDDDTGKLLTGAEAYHFMMRSIKDVKSFEELEKYEIFKWLGNFDEIQLVNKKRPCSWLSSQKMMMKILQFHLQMIPPLQLLTNQHP